MKSLHLILCFFICNYMIFASPKLHSDSIDVINYKINLTITDLTNQQISGNTELTIASKINNLNMVSLDLLKLTIDSIKVNNLVSTQFTYNDTLINIQTNPFAAGDTFKVTVFYHGHPVVDPSTWGGFYFTPTYAYNLGVGFFDNPHNYGRVWFPCIDDFIDRAFYDYYITVNTGQMAVCGGTLLSSTNNNNGTFTYHWKMINPIPTYLASVAVSNYSSVHNTFHGQLGDILTSIYVAPSDTTKAKNSFINLNNILNAFEECFGPYRWERVGYVGIPFNSGAMEHAANIAYPNSCIDGGLSYEYLYAHELSHHWFGNLITCNSAADMWINEGWATFSESIFKEKLYGNAIYKNYVRANHNQVVRYQHIEDNGYRALYGIPHEYTYSGTVYNKGADVVHSLRGYLGDSVFFNSVKNMNNAFAFKDISSTQMCDFLSANSGVDLTDFFDFWVFSPGFNHFSLDSFRTVQNGSVYDVTVYVRQRLKGATQFANSNRFDITFMDDNWNKYTSNINFSGQLGSATITVPFNPKIAMLDLEEKISDATVDNYKTIKTTGTYIFDLTYFTTLVSAVTDSVFLRVEHNWVTPDAMKNPIQNLTLSPNHYWKIEGILPAGFVAKGRFTYNATSIMQLDNELITNTLDSLKILYRSSPAEDWRLIHFIKQGNSNQGLITIDTLKTGEYTLAFYDWNNLSEKQNEQTSAIEKLKVYPNPSDTDFTIDYNAIGANTIKIINTSGKVVFEKNIQQSSGKLYWHPGKLPKGIYYVELYEKTKKIERDKIVYQ